MRQVAFDVDLKHGICSLNKGKISSEISQVSKFAWRLEQFEGS